MRLNCCAGRRHDNAAWHQQHAKVWHLPGFAALAALRMPFLPQEFAFGLAVFCCMPTTLSSGVSLTQVRTTGFKHRPLPFSDGSCPGYNLGVDCRRPVSEYPINVSQGATVNGIRASSLHLNERRVPRALSSNAHLACSLDMIWYATQAVGGNAALAVLLTVGTNLAGIFTMPFVLCGLLGAGRQALALAPGALLRNLLRTILAPLLVGAAARAFIPGVSRAPVFALQLFLYKLRQSLYHPPKQQAILMAPMQLHKQHRPPSSSRRQLSGLGFAHPVRCQLPCTHALRVPCASAGVAQQVDSHKRAMSLASAVLLITVPWMQISRVAASGVAVSPAALAAVVAAGAALHVAFLALNGGACRVLQLGGGSDPDNYVQEGVGGLSKRQQREQGAAVKPDFSCAHCCPCAI